MTIYSAAPRVAGTRLTALRVLFVVRDETKNRF